MQGWERITCVAIVPRTLLVGDEASRAAQGFRGGDQVGHQMQPLEKFNLVGKGVLAWRLPGYSDILIGREVTKTLL